MAYRLLTFLTLILSFFVKAEDPLLSQVFQQNAIEGTLIISALNSNKTYIHNSKRASTPFSPASTFKIFNTLISLNESVINNKNDTFKWNGKTHSVKSWNQDQTLESAFKVSCVWCYQELAQKIGSEKYTQYIVGAEYGQLAPQFNTTEFWLDGSLQISAEEQIEFLKKVYRQTLPLSKHSYSTLKEIMLASKTSHYSLYAKTGWALRATPVGWYVGYLEKADDVWFFAMNFPMKSAKQAPLRAKITMEALKARGLL